MMRIRPAVPQDRDALYDICARTGDAGEDARPLYREPELLGDVWVGPYLAFQPDLAFVAEGGRVATGYVLGAADTRAFDATCEKSWWPALRDRYPEQLDDDASSAERGLIRRIHHPPTTPARVLEEFPAHLHIDILPQGQGQGVGRQLMTTLFAALVEQGVTGVHLGVAARNSRAIGFYEHLGFASVGPPPSNGLLLGLYL